MADPLSLSGPLSLSLSLVLSLSPTSLPFTTGVAAEATVAWPELPASSPKVSPSLCTEDWRHCPVARGISASWRMGLAISCSLSPSTTTRRRRHGGWSSPTATARRRQQQQDVDAMVDGAGRLLQPTTAPADRHQVINDKSSLHARWRHHHVTCGIGARLRQHANRQHCRTWTWELAKPTPIRHQAGRRKGSSAGTSSRAVADGARHHAQRTCRRAVPKASREDDDMVRPLLCGSTKTRRRADTYDDSRVNSASD